MTLPVLSTNHFRPTLKLRLAFQSRSVNLPQSRNSYRPLNEAIKGKNEEKIRVSGWPFIVSKCERNENGASGGREMNKKEEEKNEVERKRPATLRVSGVTIAFASF